MNGYIFCKTEIKERLTPQMVSGLFEVDFAEREYGVGLSREDRQFLKIVEDGIHHRDDMHYKVPCPLEKISSSPITVLKQSNACRALRRDSKATQSMALTTSGS